MPISLQEVFERARGAGQSLTSSEAAQLFAAATRLAAAQGATLRSRLVALDESGAIALTQFDDVAPEDEPGYLAPELLSGDAPRKSEPRVQVYAAGALGYELLAGRPPPEPGQLPGPELTGALGDLVRLALASDRRERFGDLTQLYDAVEGVQARPSPELERQLFAGLVARAQKWKGPQGAAPAELAQLAAKMEELSARMGKLDDLAARLGKVDAMSSAVARLQAAQRDAQARVEHLEHLEEGKQRLSAGAKRGGGSPWLAAALGGGVVALVIVGAALAVGLVQLGPQGRKWTGRGEAQDAHAAVQSDDSSTAQGSAPGGGAANAAGASAQGSAGRPGATGSPGAQAGAADTAAPAGAAGANAQQASAGAASAPAGAGNSGSAPVRAGGQGSAPGGAAASGSAQGGTAAASAPAGSDGKTGAPAGAAPGNTGPSAAAAPSDETASGAKAPATADPSDDGSKAAKQGAGAAPVKREDDGAARPDKSHARRTARATSNEPVSAAMMAHAVAQSQVNRGDKALEKGHTEEAIDSFRAAIENEPALATAYRGLGLAYTLQRNDAKARESYERYLQLAPSASDAADIRRAIEELQARSKIGGDEK